MLHQCEVAPVELRKVGRFTQQASSKLQQGFALGSDSKKLNFHLISVNIMGFDNAILTTPL